MKKRNKALANPRAIKRYQTIKHEQHTKMVRKTDARFYQNEYESFNAIILAVKHQLGFHI